MMNNRVIILLYYHMSNKERQSGILFSKICLVYTTFKVFVEFVTVLLLFLCFGFLATRHVEY